MRIKGRARGGCRCLESWSGTAYRWWALGPLTGYDLGMITYETLAEWLVSPEGERLEFKEARRSFSYREVHEYLVALANEGGGHLVLGVANAIPRTVVGTDALRDHAQQVHELNRQLGQRVDVTEIQPPEGRVVVVSIGPRRLGQPLAYRVVTSCGLVRARSR